MLLPFTGSGCLKEYNGWKISVQLCCYHWGLANSVVQASVAQWTFQERASKWWLGYQVYTPTRLYSLAQILEWVGIELAPRSNLEASQLEWNALEYKGLFTEVFQEGIRSPTTVPNLAALRRISSRPDHLAPSCRTTSVRLMLGLGLEGYWMSSGKP